MGLFDWLGLGHKDPQPPPPPVPRRILVSGSDRTQLVDRLKEYGRVAPPGPEVRFTVAGPIDGWGVVVPTDDLHAHWFHNIALWLAEGDTQVLAISRGAAAPFAYWLTDDTEFSDFLAGWTHDGQTSVAVHVPDNKVARGIKIGLPAQTLDQALSSRRVPRGLALGPLDQLPGPSQVALKLEALGAQLNPGMISSLANRSEA